jgi:hypothetical protein
MVISRLGAIPKPRSSKMRLIVGIPFVNEWADVPKFVFGVLLYLRDLMSKGDYIISYDQTYVLRHIELHSAARRFVAFRWQGKYYVYKVLPFGRRSAPCEFAKTVLVLVAR